MPNAVRHFGLDAFGVWLTLAAHDAGLVAGALVAARIVAAVPFGVGAGRLAGLAVSLLMAL